MSVSIARVTALAEREMNLHMPKLVANGWKFALNTRGTRFMGRCDYRKRLIEVATHWLPGMSEDNALDTIRHEIAHALTPGSGHGVAWKSKAMELGCNPRATGNVEFREAVKAKFAIVFKNSQGMYEKIGSANRALRNIKKRYAKGRKAETLGKLFMMAEKEWQLHQAAYQMADTKKAEPAPKVEPEVKKKQPAKTKPAVKVSDLDQPEHGRAKKNESLRNFLDLEVWNVLSKHGPVSNPEILARLKEDFSSDLALLLPDQTKVDINYYLKKQILACLGRLGATKNGKGRAMMWSM